MKKKICSVALAAAVCSVSLGIFAACGDKTETDLSALNRELFSPQTVSLQTKEQMGYQLSAYLYEAEVLDYIIDALFLDSWEKDFEHSTGKNGVYTLAEQGHTLIADATSLTIYADEQEEVLFYHSVTQTEKIIRYHSENTEIEYRETSADGSTVVELNRDGTNYSLTLTDEGYSLDCNYELDSSVLIVTKEMYGSDGAFTCFECFRSDQFASDGDDGKVYTTYFTAYALPYNGLDKYLDEDGRLYIQDDEGNLYQYFGYDYGDEDIEDNEENNRLFHVYFLQEYENLPSETEYPWFIFVRNGKNLSDSLIPYPSIQG